ncbi:MAG: hypothetical protein CMJ67_10525 [Planctomycetaceae bacterium]|nr:hypothetical protein [Planctomycetaceae bacterium]
MTYAKGQFQSYRAITKIHLGAISDNLSEGEEIEYDGHVLKRGSDEHSLHSLRAAIKVGWLVPVEDTSSAYVPQPAGVKVHKADGTDDRQEIDLDTVFETDVNVGTLDEVRPDAAPKTHKATAAGQQNSSEGKVVSRIKTSAKSDTVQIGKDDRQVVASLDNKSGIEVERVAVATGDVQEAIGGEDLTELLPDAESAGIPNPGPSGEGAGDQSESRARSAAGSTVGGADDGVVVARIGETSPDPSGLTLIQQFIPDFEWDMSIQWAKRVKIACEKYGDIPAVLDYINSVETETVKKHLAKRLAESKR